MSMHPLTLARRLNAMIAVESRPAEQRDRYSARRGWKRTELQEVRAIPAEHFAGALPVKQSSQGDVANMGHSTWGGFTSGPLTAEAINQGNLADCYLLIAMFLVARLRPNFFDDIFVKVDDQTAIVQWYYAGYILQIRTSLLISTDYDHPSNGDVRPELAEKTWCLVRSGLSDYAQDNDGMIYAVFTALGLDGTTGTLNSDAIIQAMQAGKAVGLQTTPTVVGRNAVEPWVQNHAYGAVDFDVVSKNLTLVQPWHATVRIGGVDPATIAGGKVFNIVHLGTFPAAPRILAGMVTAPAMMVAPATIPVPAPASAAIHLPATGLTLTPDQNTSLVNCQIETVGTKMDIGYVSGAAWVEFTLEVAMAGTYQLGIEMAAVAAAGMDVSVNGVVQATGVVVPNTKAWAQFTTVTVDVILPAGTVTLRLANQLVTQYNIGTIDVRPAAPDDPVVAISIITTRKSGKAVTTAVGNF